MSWLSREDIGEFLELISELYGEEELRGEVKILKYKTGWILKFNNLFHEIHTKNLERGFEISYSKFLEIYNEFEKEKVINIELDQRKCNVLEGIEYINLHYKEKYVIVGLIEQKFDLDDQYNVSFLLSLHQIYKYLTENRSIIFEQSAFGVTRKKELTIQEHNYKKLMKFISHYGYDNKDVKIYFDGIEMIIKINRSFLSLILA